MAVDVDIKTLSILFGQVENCYDVEQYAKQSKKLFVRSQDQLAFDNQQATGLRLSAWQAFKTYGLETLLEIIEYGSAILTVTANEPSDTIKSQRELLGLTHRDVAHATKLDEDDVIDAENPQTRTDIHILAKIAQLLAIEELQLSYLKGAKSDEDLTLRLKEIGGPATAFKPRLVTNFTEAAWVIRKQSELQKWLSPTQQNQAGDENFEADDKYGAIDYPVWLHGYYLADKTRKILGLGDKPIPCLRRLIEDDLGIPLIQMTLPSHIGGATIAIGNTRGLVANAVGYNENVWIRRATLAHELGHLLWDPDEKLRRVTVDNYDSIKELYAVQYDTHSDRRYDPVEARANAFAIAFLAPQDATQKVYESTQGSNGEKMRNVMETFGISYMAAKYHLWNILEQKVPLDDLVVDEYEPTDEWTAMESYTLDYFEPRTVPISRRGRFACEVVKAYEGNLIAMQTAAFYLGCSENEFVENKDLIISLF